MIQLETLALKFTKGLAPAELAILDQTLLPHQEKWITLDCVAKTIEAIKALRVRGAPLIGVVASLSLAQSADLGTDAKQLLEEADSLYEARPTAVNLMVCMERMRKLLRAGASASELLSAAVAIFNEDVQLCDRIAANGAELLQTGDSILTHCNTGALATAGVGTALGVIQKAHSQGKTIHVYVDETRPLLQGGRLTAWELQKLGIPYTLITDNMAGHLMNLGKIQKAIVGCDRIAANGDFANKIGTYSVAVLCQYHKIPFYVAGPYTTMDWECPSGAAIPIEQRRSQEVLGVEGSFGTIAWAPKDSPVYNPAFDVTPSSLVSHWILDSGVYDRSDFENRRVKKCLQ